MKKIFIYDNLKTEKAIVKNIEQECQLSEMRFVVVDAETVKDRNNILNMLFERCSFKKDEIENSAVIVRNINELFSETEKFYVNGVKRELIDILKGSTVKYNKAESIVGLESLCVFATLQSTYVIKTAQIGFAKCDDTKKADMQFKIGELNKYFKQDDIVVIETKKADKKTDVMQDKKNIKKDFVSDDKSESTNVEFEK